MEIAVIVVAVVIVVMCFVAVLTKRGGDDRLVKYSYVAKTQIMTNAEKMFYDKLLLTLGNDHYIVPQAHLSMFINHKIKGQNWKAAFSIINGKSVDYLIVEKTSQRPVLAIELDDYTHDRAERKRRDKIVEEILKKAEIPLQRYQNYNQFIQHPLFTLPDTTSQES
ncbi:MAG TPA: DUF2726 domain-containing protein [Candidatus Saccharimonadales bacterium]|nr:DUF2726 domain-containing protein [Candidatus Saccharimonadales bacterium]